MDVIETLKRPHSKNESSMSGVDPNEKQSIIDFVNNNEEECARLLSNNWAPMKRRRTTHSQRADNSSCIATNAAIGASSTL